MTAKRREKNPRSDTPTRTVSVIRLFKDKFNTYPRMTTVMTRVVNLYDVLQGGPL